MGKAILGALSLFFILMICQTTAAMVDVRVVNILLLAFGGVVVALGLAGVFILLRRGRQYDPATVVKDGNAYINNGTGVVVQVQGPTLRQSLAHFFLGAPPVGTVITKHGDTNPALAAAQAQVHIARAENKRFGHINVNSAPMLGGRRNDEGGVIDVPAVPLLPAGTPSPFGVDGNDADNDGVPISFISAPEGATKNVRVG